MLYIIILINAVHSNHWAGEQATHTIVMKMEYIALWDWQRDAKGSNELEKLVTSTPSLCLCMYVRTVTNKGAS